MGGGQLTLDIKPDKYPIAVSISNEYYTNSADPTHSYEIKGMFVVNALYMKKPFKNDRINVFAGGGAGVVQVPEDDTDDMVSGTVFNLEAGINVKAFWKIGFYGVGKYLYAQKKVNNVKVIDFNEFIVLLGLTFTFGI